MVNVPRIYQLIEQIQKNLKKLKFLSRLPGEEFLSDFTKCDSAKYELQTAIEACLDIGSHIIASENYDKAETYAEVFKVLVSEGVVGQELLSNLVSMARFRNRLVHMYWEIDDQSIYDIVKEKLSDFDSYLRYIVNWIEKK